MDPTVRALALVEAASAAIGEKDFAGAFQFLGRAEDLDRDVAELHHTRGIALYMQKRNDQAIASVKRALELKPKYHDAWNTLGRIYLELGKYPDSEAALLRASENFQYQDIYKALTNLGVLYYRQTEMAKAVDAFEQSVRIDPLRSCFAHYYLGHIALARNDLKRASSEYHDASVKACGGFADAHLALGIVWQRQKEYDKARKKYLDLAKAFPETNAAKEASKRLRGMP